MGQSEAPEAVPSSPPGESLWTKVGVVAGVVAALAALAVFLVPQAERDDPADEPADEPRAAVTGPAPAPPETAAPGTSAAAATTSRSLAALTPVSGVDAVRVAGRDLEVGCASGRSDDPYREVMYALPAEYDRLDARVTVAGDGADPEDEAALQVFVHERRDRRDRLREVTRVVRAAGGTGTLAADVTGATAVVLRLTCDTQALRMTIAAPALVRAA